MVDLARPAVVNSSSEDRSVLDFLHRIFVWACETVYSNSVWCCCQLIGIVGFSGFCN